MSGNTIFGDETVQEEDLSSSVSVDDSTEDYGESLTPEELQEFDLPVPQRGELLRALPNVPFSLRNHEISIPSVDEKQESSLEGRTLLDLILVYRRSKKFWRNRVTCFGNPLIPQNVDFFLRKIICYRNNHFESFFNLLWIINQECSRRLVGEEGLDLYCDRNLYEEATEAIESQLSSSGINFPEGPPLMIFKILWEWWKSEGELTSSDGPYSYQNDRQFYFGFRL